MTTTYYRPRPGYSIDPERCRASVYHEHAGSFQCSRKPAVGLWCRQHSPEATEERRRQSDEREREYVAQLRRSALRGRLGQVCLDHGIDSVELLEALITP